MDDQNIIKAKKELESDGCKIIGTFRGSDDGVYVVAEKSGVSRAYKIYSGLGVAPFTKN